MISALVRAIFLAFAALLLAPAAATAAGETSIFYYPWWGTPKRDGSFLHWNQRGHAPPVDLATTYYPARGVYSSSDWKLLRSQMKEIAGSGVREVVSSWWGRGSIEDRRLPAVMRAAWKDKLDVASQLEPYEKTRRTAEVVAAISPIFASLASSASMSTSRSTAPSTTKRGES
jgi:hypothetical protein